MNEKKDYRSWPKEYLEGSGVPELDEKAESLMTNEQKELTKWRLRGLIAKIEKAKEGIEALNQAFGELGFNLGLKYDPESEALKHGKEIVERYQKVIDELKSQLESLD